MNQENEKSYGRKETDGQVHLGMDEQELVTMVKNLAEERDALKKERDEQNRNLENLYAKLRDTEKQASEKDKILQENEEFLKSRSSSSEKKIRKLKCVMYLSVFLVLIFICVLISKNHDYNQLLDEKNKLRTQSEQIQTANEKLQKDYEEIQVSYKNQQDLNLTLQKIYEELREYEGLYGGGRISNFYADTSFMVMEKGETRGLYIHGIRSYNCSIEDPSDGIKCGTKSSVYKNGSTYIEVEAVSPGVHSFYIKNERNNTKIRVLVIVKE